jgi:plastocyanin
MVRTVRRSITRGVLTGVPAAALLILSMAPTALAVQHAVKIVDFSFAPNSVSVTVGDTVEWTNGGSVGHTATADDGSWDTGLIASGTRKSVAFATVGTFAYHCTVHASMTGTVVVTAKGSPPATDAVAPSAPVTGSDGPGWLLVVAAALGLAVGHRRFGGDRAGERRRA